MNRTVLILIVVIVIVAAAGGAYFFLGNQPASTGNTTDGAGETTEVAVTEESREPTPTETPAVVVVEAVQLITRGTRIDRTMVAERVFPAQYAPRSSISSVDDVIGTIAATDIQVEEIILSSKLVVDFTQLGEEGSDAAAVLDPEKVAIAVPIDRITSVAYALQPGDRVDVIVSMLFVDVDQDFQTLLPNNFRIISGTADPDTGTITLTTGESQTGELDSRTLIVPAVGAALSSNFSVLIEPSERQRPRLLTVRTVTNARVIWVDDFPPNGRIFQATSTPVPPTEDPNAEQGGSSGEAGGSPVPPTANPRPTIVTLEVSPQDAVILSYMVEAGMPMTFALRAAFTQGVPPANPVTLDYIMTRYNVTQPDRFNYAIEPAIRSIRGITLQDIAVPEQ